MQHKTKITIGLTLLAAFGSTVIAPMAAASTQGRRNTAIGLTAATILAAVKGESKAALVAGAGAAYAWKRTADAQKQASYRRGYHKGYAYGHRKHYKKVYYRKHGRLYYRYVRCH